ncbi:MAG TPA: DUF255 domain-containing protein [Polyangiaceae bacterium]|jgi:hypothetical protein
MLKRTIAAFGFALAACTAAGGARAPSVEAHPIAWHRFGPAAFDEARRSGKIVMVDAGIEGCSACRWMHEGAYHDPNVIRRIEQSFVPVSVDADQEPDLGDRFLPWGWPATIFFTPDGHQVYALQGSESGGELAELLDSLVAKQKDGTLGQGATTGHGSEPNQDSAAACVDANQYLASMADDYGWGGDERVALFGPFEHALIRARSRGDTKLSARALAVAEGEAKLLDPVWGGIFVGAFSKTWDNPIPEKRTIFEAGALDAFSLELQRTGDARWKSRADLVRKYLEDWMLAPDGTFYSTQQDRAPQLPANLEPGDYYAMKDADRRKYGIPPIDHGVYTDQNALVIQSYVRFYEATGDRAALEIAKRAADALLAKRTRADGGMEQAELEPDLAKDRRMRPTTPDTRLYLKAQGEMGLALLFLHEATAEDHWLDAAKKIASAMHTLEDAEHGGFFGTTARDVDALVPRRKPFIDNAGAARFLIRLAGVTRDETYRKTAERTLAALAPNDHFEGSWGAGLLALAYEELVLGPVEVTVVRGGDDALARSLHDELVRVYEPRKIVRVEDAGHYPKPKTGAAIYVCTRSACSSPVTTAEAARKEIDRMTIAEGAPCP